MEQVAVSYREVSPPEWAPWSLLSGGAVVMLYSFTLPAKMCSELLGARVCVEPSQQRPAAAAYSLWRAAVSCGARRAPCRPDPSRSTCRCARRIDRSLSRRVCHPPYQNSFRRSACRRRLSGAVTWPFSYHSFHVPSRHALVVWQFHPHLPVLIPVLLHAIGLPAKVVQFGRPGLVVIPLQPRSVLLSVEVGSPRLAATVGEPQDRGTIGIASR